MRRRAFLAALSSALGWSPDSFAQQPTHVRPRRHHTSAANFKKLDARGASGLTA
ncbi:MAG: hypothetical protein K0R61_3182 [Microvirga sp.]|nr:hypothetical protein [Microvirga sp.]